MSSTASAERTAAARLSEAASAHINTWLFIADAATDSRLERHTDWAGALLPHDADPND
jgi:hypothetical protein